VPPSSQGVPYASFEYLQKLAQQIQANKSLGVLPTAVSIADKWMTLDDLNRLPGVGQAHLNGVPMSSYVMSMTAPFVPDAQRKEGGWLRLMEPTRPMQDQNDSIYIVRVTAAESTHKPATIAEVEPQLRADLLTARAYALAKADAQKLLDQARQQGNLKAAASAAGLKSVIAVGPITHREGQVIPPLALTGAGADRFVNGAFRLLATTRPAAGPSVAPSTAPAASTQTAAGSSLTATKPIDLVELPRDGRVLVGQLGDVQAMWTERSVPMEEAQIHRAIGMGLMQRFIQSWFDYDSVVARTHFVPEGNPEELRQESAPAQPVPPIM
jgi:hypothetical protein